MVRSCCAANAAVWLALALLLAGCGASAIEADEACAPYPKDLVGRFDCPEAPAAALAALAEINPDAWGNWDTLRCSFGELHHLAIPLQGCVGEAALADYFFAAIDAHPDAFGMFSSELTLETRPAGLDCGDLVLRADAATSPSDADTYASLERIAYGGNDFHAYLGVAQFAVDSGVVLLDEIAFIENLTVDEELGARLAACPAADQDALAQALLAQTYTYLEWINPTGGLCSGEIVTRAYAPAPGDTVTWLDDGASWIESGTELRLVREARLAIAPENRPSGSHDLSCYDEAGELWLGFDIGIDVVTGEVVATKAGGPCITC